MTPSRAKKSDLVAMVACGLAHESFEHSECGIFDITVLREVMPVLLMVDAVQKIRVPLDQICDFIRACRDYEEDRIRELGPESLDDPGICLKMPDGTDLLIDGTHRALRRERDGEQEMKFFSIPYEIANAIARPTQSYRRLGAEWGDPEFWNKHGGPRPEFPGEGENHE